MLIRLLLTVGLLLGCHTACAEASPLALETLQQQLANQGTLRGEFKQQKQIKILSRPIIAAGEFIIDRQQGILWQQTAPVSSTTLLTRQGISQRDSQQNVMRLSAQQSPQLWALTQIFFGLFTGDYSSVQEHFELSLSQPGSDHWQIALAPKPGFIANVFSGIVLQGQMSSNKKDNSASLSQIILTEVNGDATDIALNTSGNRDALTASEQQRFTAF